MRTIIITGASSGTGYQCALHLAALARHEQIILACPDTRAGKSADAKITQQTGHTAIRVLHLDLASLQSIRSFCQQAAQQGIGPVSALVNHAGIQSVGPIQYTADGFEATFGINHLGPFCLTLLLLPWLAADARITFTASGAHDPAQKHPLAPPAYTGADGLAHPVETGERKIIAGQRRYTTSKLCNILTVYELQRQLWQTDIRVNAFEPGLVPGTGLVRDYPLAVRLLWMYIMPVLIPFQRNAHTARRSGRNLAHLAWSPAYSAYRGKYFEGKREIRSSEDSYNTDFQQDLWEGSLRLTGLSKAETIDMAGAMWR